MTPTLFTACNSLPPEGAVFSLGRPGGKGMTPTLFTQEMIHQETPWRA